MKTIFNKIKSIFNLNNNENKPVECNYTNNYYGDQYCQSKLKRKHIDMSACDSTADF